MDATGIGSLPGEDVDAAVALVFDSLPELPHLPELPARGPGADLIGRTATALADLAVDLQPAGWRLVARPGADERRGRAMLERDLDALVPVAADYDGRLKVQLAGPWTLAAHLELPRGGPVLGDAGATRDVAQSLVETVRIHLADVQRRVPRARLVLQLDEPSLPAVLAGAVRTASGLGRVPAVDPTVVAAALRDVVAAAGDDVPVAVHCCAADVPLGVIQDAGAAVASFALDVAVLDPAEVAERVERGLGLWVGIVPSSGPGVAPAVREVADPLRRFFHRIGLSLESLVAATTVTPTCGLGAASDGWARTALGLVRRTARVLAEAPEVVAG